MDAISQITNPGADALSRLEVESISTTVAPDFEAMARSQEIDADV